ncbi:zf-HC2 domain-containing protein [Blastococcus sp. CT_GayMR20]|uniref:anti-sigma factor family protein n=1 Tax=Blastococcus sp. CT_GayMR20 TaxID=2559609 RepID=UPI0014301316|nr:zf-HC2 domain-containing protein [Blastococcus sp. CT_GayMR20]
MTCSDATVALGAYVLGALEPDERQQVEEHVRTCPACAAELAGLRSLPGLLERVRPEDLLPVPVTPSPDLFARTAAAVGAERPRTLRSRTWALAAAVVLAVLGIGAGVTVWATGQGEQTASATSGPVRVSVTASPARDGSAIEVTVAGLRPGETCGLVAFDRDGRRYDAGTWPASSEGDGTWTGWADVDSGALAGAVILGDGGRELARVTF